MMEDGVKEIDAQYRQLALPNVVQYWVNICKEDGLQETELWFIRLLAEDRDLWYILQMDVVNRNK